MITQKDVKKVFSFLLLLEEDGKESRRKFLLVFSFLGMFLLGMHRISGRPDNPAFFISGIRPDIRQMFT
jgi:hypothetical protein